MPGTTGDTRITGARGRAWLRLRGRPVVADDPAQDAGRVGRRLVVGPRDELVGPDEDVTALVGGPRSVEGVGEHAQRHAEVARGGLERGGRLLFLAERDQRVAAAQFLEDVAA